jgi:ring-1,2-phenylacetyl-CoA epoxidase subunit PaaC
MPEISQQQDLHLLKYALQIADNALILGHRISEWCGHGPILEQDIALTNMSLDHLGQARSLYQYAAELYNQLPDKETVFNTIATGLLNNGQADEDDLAFMRDAADFYNVLLVEQPNGDWAQTIARSFYQDSFNYFFYRALQNVNDSSLAAIAEKSLKEVSYHLRWSSEWVIRLGDGTEESRERMQRALDELWVYTGELFKPSVAEQAVAAVGKGISGATLHKDWLAHVQQVIDEATLTLPEGAWMQEGGKQGVHSEHLGFILAEMQFMQRAYPGMEW